MGSVFWLWPDPGGQAQGPASPPGAHRATKSNPRKELRRTSPPASSATSSSLPSVCQRLGKLLHGPYTRDRRRGDKSLRTAGAPPTPLPPPHNPGPRTPKKKNQRRRGHPFRGQNPPIP